MGRLLLAMIMFMAIPVMSKAEESPSGIVEGEMPIACMHQDMFNSRLTIPLWVGIMEDYKYTLAENVDDGDWVLTMQVAGNPLVCIIGGGARHDFIVEEAENG